MTPREITFAALFALAGAGGVYVMDSNGQPQQVAIVPEALQATQLSDIQAQAVFLDDAGKPRVFTNGAVVRCTAGVLLDGVQRDDKELCTDGMGQAWVRDAQGAETITIIDGQALSQRIQ